MAKQSQKSDNILMIDKNQPPKPWIKLQNIETEMKPDRTDTEDKSSH